jgi:3-oxoacyl-[acyl-carrier protein] reductase
VDLGLDGRVALVAGGEDAVVGACAAAIAAEGATVESFAGLGGAADLAADLLARHGRLDVVVACHPRHEAAGPVDVPDVNELRSGWNALVDTVALFRAALPAMSDRGWGRLVTVTTSGVKWLQDDTDEIDGIVGLGLLGMQKSLVADAARHGITANAVLRASEGDDAVDVADLVCFLASTRPGFTAGVSIALDGARSPVVF